VVNDHTVGNDNIDNSTQWVVQTNFRATVNPFSDRTGVSITSTGNGTLDGKTWIRTAADSKSFGTGVTPPPTLASFTVTGTFVDLLVDDRHGGGARPSWLDTSFTDAGFNVTINDGSATRPYSVWRKSVTPGSTVNLPAIGSTMAPCYIVVVE